MTIDERLEELQSLTSRYIKSIAMDFVVVLVALAYIFYQMVTLEPTYLNPLVLVAQAIMGIICGVVIKQALGENGFSRGYNSRIWIEEEIKYNDACNTAIKYMEYVDNFYQYEEIEKRKNYRRSQLQLARLKYDMWFDNNGDYIGTAENESKLDKRQKRVLNKCVKVKIYPLNLFSQYPVTSEKDTKPEITDARKRAKNITSNTFTATLVAIIGVYFMPMINNWSWGSFISATMQVALWVLFGILQLYTNYNYVVQDKVALLKTKKECIKRFTTGCDKGLYMISPYEKIEKENQVLQQLQNAPIIVSTSE